MIIFHMNENNGLIRIDVDNNYIELLNEITEQKDKKIFCINTLFLSDFDFKLRKNYDLSRIYKKLSLKNLKKFIIPSHINGNHWIVFVIFIELHQIIVYNSLNKEASLDSWDLIPIVDLIRKFLIGYGRFFHISHFIDIPWIFYEIVYRKPQIDIINCAIFVLVNIEIQTEFIDCVISKIKILNINNHRKRIHANINKKKIITSVNEKKLISNLDKPKKSQYLGCGQILNYISPIIVDNNREHDILEVEYKIQLLKELEKIKNSDTLEIEEESDLQNLSYRDSIFIDQYIPKRIEFLMNHISNNIFNQKHISINDKIVEVIISFNSENDNDFIIERNLCETIQDLKFSRMRLFIIENNSFKLNDNIKKFIVPSNDIFPFENINLKTLGLKDALYCLLTSFPRKFLDIIIYKDLDGIYEDYDNGIILDPYLFISDSISFKQKDLINIREKILRNSSGLLIILNPINNWSRVNIQVSKRLLSTTTSAKKYEELNYQNNKKKKKFDNIYNLQTYDQISQTMYQLYDFKKI